MLNSLAAYLLGGAAQPVDEPENQNPPMRITSVEVDDWLLVDKELPSDSEESIDSPAARLTDSEGEQRSSPPPVLPMHKQHGSRNFRQVDKSRSASCSPARTMEESWFVTPPPCFTSQGPGELATGPLENLLIEHPSMSVYQRGRYTTLESLELTDENTRDDSPAPTEAPTDATNAPNDSGSARGLRGARGSPTAQMQREEKEKNSKKNNKGRQPLKRGALERSNKAREVNTRNARRRRADHAQAQRHSRANNNRKCC